MSTKETSNSNQNKEETVNRIILEALSKVGVYDLRKNEILEKIKIKEFLDYECKRIEFNLTDKKEAIELVKDICALHNTNNVSYLLMGIDEKATTKSEITGLKDLQLFQYFDSEGKPNNEIKKIFSLYMTYQPLLNYFSGKVNEFLFSVIKIERGFYPLRIKKQAEENWKNSNYVLFPKIPIRFLDKRQEPQLDYIDPQSSKASSIWKYFRGCSFESLFNSLFDSSFIVWIRLPLPTNCDWSSLKNLSFNLVIDCAQNIQNTNLNNDNGSFSGPDKLCSEFINSNLCFNLPHYNPNKTGQILSLPLYNPSWILMNSPISFPDSDEQQRNLFRQWKKGFSFSFNKIIDKILPSDTKIVFLVLVSENCNRYHQQMVNFIVENRKNSDTFVISEKYDLIAAYSGDIIISSINQFIQAIPYFPNYSYPNASTPFILISSPRSEKSIELNMWNDMKKLNLYPLIFETGKVKYSEIFDEQYDSIRENDMEYLRGSKWKWNDCSSMSPSDKSKILQSISQTMKTKKNPFLKPIEIQHQPGEGGSSFAALIVSHFAAIGPVIFTKNSSKIIDQLNLIAQFSAHLNETIIFFANDLSINLRGITLNECDYRIVVIFTNRIKFQDAKTETPPIYKEDIEYQIYKVPPISNSTILFYKQKGNLYHKIHGTNLQVGSPESTYKTFFELSFFTFYNHVISPEEYIKELVNSIEPNSNLMKILSVISLIQFYTQQEAPSNWFNEPTTIPDWFDQLVSAKGGTLRFRHFLLAKYFLQSLSNISQVFLYFSELCTLQDEVLLQQLSQQKIIDYCIDNENNLDQVLETIENLLLKFSESSHQKFHILISKSKVLVKQKKMMDAMDCCDLSFKFTKNEKIKECLVNVAYATIQEKYDSPNFILIVNYLEAAYKAYPKKSRALALSISWTIDRILLKKNIDTNLFNCAARSFFLLSILAPWRPELKKENLSLLNTELNLKPSNYLNHKTKLYLDACEETPINTELDRVENDEVLLCFKIMNQDRTVDIVDQILTLQGRLYGIKNFSDIQVFFENESPYIRFIYGMVDSTRKLIPIHFRPWWRKDPNYKNSYLIDSNSFSSLVKHALRFEGEYNSSTNLVKINNSTLNAIPCAWFISKRENLEVEVILGLGFQFEENKLKAKIMCWITESIN